MYLPLKNLNPHECYLYFVSGHLYSWKAASLTSFLQKRVNVNVGQHFLLGKRKKKAEQNHVICSLQRIQLNCTEFISISHHLMGIQGHRHAHCPQFWGISEYADLAITVFLIRQQRDEYLCIQRMDCIYIHLPTVFTYIYLHMYTCCEKSQQCSVPIWEAL